MKATCLLLLVALCAFSLHPYGARAGSAYLTVAETPIVMDGSGSIQDRYGYFFGGGGTILPNACGAWSCSMTNTDTAYTYNVGFTGVLNVTNIPEGSQPQLIVKLNGNTYWSNDLVPGQNYYNYVFKGSQYFASGDTISTYVSGASGTTFTFGNTCTRYFCDRFYLLWVQSSQRRQEEEDDDMWKHLVSQRTAEDADRMVSELEARRIVSEGEYSPRGREAAEAHVASLRRDAGHAQADLLAHHLLGPVAPALQQQHSPLARS